MNLDTYHRLKAGDRVIITNDNPEYHGKVFHVSHKWTTEIGFDEKRYIVCTAETHGDVIGFDYTIVELLDEFDSVSNEDLNSILIGGVE